MKKLVVSAVITLLTMSPNAQANTEEAAQNFAALFMFKTYVNQAAESTQELTQTVAENAKAYQGLGFIQLAKKTKIARQNCADIEVANSSIALTLVSLIEAVGEDLRKLPELNHEVAEEKLSKIIEYIRSAQVAADKCANPTESLVHIKKAYAALAEANAYLESVKNELPK